MRDILIKGRGPGFMEAGRPGGPGFYACRLQRVDSGCYLSQMQETGSLQLGSVVSQRQRKWGGAEVKFQDAKEGGYFLRVPFLPRSTGFRSSPVSPGCK